MNTDVKIPVLLTVQQFCDAHRAFTPGGLRWQIFNEKTNGLSGSGAIIRVGRRVYIDEVRYFAWIAAHQPNDESPVSTVRGSVCCEG